MRTPRQRADALAWLRKNRRELRLLIDPPPEKPSALSQAELLKRLRVLRDGWEALTTRNQDLPDERLAEESRAALNAHYAWYVSEEARAILAGSLGELLLALAPRR